MAVSTLAALASTGTQWAVTTGFLMAQAVKTFAISFALSAISRALTPKPQIDTSTGLSSTVKSPTQARPILYGRTKTAGTVVYVQTSGDDSKYLHLVLAMAGHEIDAYEEIYIDDELAWKVGTVQTKFSTTARFNLYTGNQTTADADLVSESNEWTETCVLNGTAYIYARLEYDVKVYNNGIPNITAIVRGKKVYNPVTDVTEWTQNPALCIADYINDSKYGLTGISIDSTALAESVGVCAQQVDFENESGQTQQHDRYQINGYIDTSGKVSSNIENMLSCMFGEVVYSQGKLHIKAGYYKEPVLDIDESVIVGDITLQTKQSKRSQYNGVKGVFLSSEENYTLADYPAQLSSAYALEDGEPNYLDMTLPFTTDNIRAQRLAKLALGKSRQQRVITVPVNLVGLKIKAGDNVRINNTKLGLVNAVYQVADYELDFSEQLKVNLVCIETGASLYDWTVADQQDFSVATDVQLWDGSAKPPTGLNATSTTEILNDGTTSVHIDVSWTAPDDVYFDYYVLKFGNSSITTKDTSYRITNVDQSGVYEISVIAYNNRGRASAELTSQVTNQIDTVAPSSPSSISLTAGFKQIELSWTNPTDNDFDLIEIKSNTENNDATASLIASIRSDYYLHRLDANKTRFYWLRALDRTGNASDWVYGGTGTTERLLANDFADGVITVDFLDESTTNIINSVANYDTDISDINTSITNLDTDIADLNLNVETRALDSDFQNITQSLDNNLTTASERLLSMSLFASEQAQIMRDAGVTVDPDNGSVTIQAVEQLRTETDTQFTQVGIEIDAQTAEIELRATRTFVENEIAAAQLDPTDFTAFTDLQARVNQAEIDIDANTASVVLKADQTELDSLDVRVNQAEIDIDANSASIALKASQSEFDDLSTRITTAEIQLDAIDAPSITQTVIDVNNLSHRVNQAEAQDLKQLLEIYDTRQVLQQDIAFARTQITADTVETRESIATQKTELLALIDQNEASIIAETQARSNADSAIASDVLQLQTELNIAESDISGNATAITSLDSRVTTNEGDITSQAGQITALESGLTTAEGDITSNATAITNLDTRVTSAEGTITTQSTDITNLETDITNLETDTSANATAISGLSTRVTQTETDITSQSTDITNLQTDVTNLETDTSGNATAIGGLDTRVTSAEGSISTQSTSITNLETSVTNLETDTTNNATAITNLTTTVTQNGNDITAVAQDLTELRTDVDGNTAEIVNVSETASSETRASAKRLETLVSGQAETQLTEILNRENNQDNLNSEIAIVRSDFNAVTIANQESIAQARTDLTALINGNSADITSEQLARASADQVLASDINSLRADLTTAEGNITGNADATTLLTARVDVTEDNITSISADVTTLQSGLTGAETDITANGSAITALDTRVTSNETSITSQASDITTLQSDLSTASTNITSNATAISGIDTRVTATETTITSQSTAITNLESSVDDLETDTSNNATALTNLSTTVTNQGTSISTNATAITNLQTTTGSNTASISTLQSTTDGIEAQYSVTINNNGTLSGFGLVSDIINGEPTSAFTVSANQFSLLGSSTGEVWDNTADYVIGDIVTYLGRTYEATDASSNVNPSSNPDEWDDVTETPFEVYTADTVVSKGGEDVTIPKGVYIKDGFIQKASITDANIQSLNADKITAGTINTSRLNIDGVTLDTDATGQLVISDGGVDTTQIKNNAVTSTLDAYTASGISNLANATKEVQTLTIQATGAPVQIIATARISVNSGNFSYGSVIIKRNGSTIRTQTYSAFTNNSANEVLITRDEPSAGDVTYTIEVYSDASSSTLISSRYLQAMETKK